MGSEIVAEGPPVISGKIGGTNKLELVEIVKYENKAYSILYSESPDAEITEIRVEDPHFDSDCFYYLRVTQAPEVPGRLWTYPTHDMAWSSPVWVKFNK
jgi:hypothetical protein